MLSLTQYSFKQNSEKAVVFVQPLQYNMLSNCNIDQAYTKRDSLISQSNSRKIASLWEMWQVWLYKMHDNSSSNILKYTNAHVKIKTQK